MVSYTWLLLCTFYVEYIFFFCFPYVSFCRSLPHSVCVYVFLEGLHDFIELSHPRVREFRVCHLSINKGETEVTQQLHSSYSSFAGSIGDGVRGNVGLSKALTSEEKHHEKNGLITLYFPNERLPRSILFQW